jgi:hypothetical protein
MSDPICLFCLWDSPLLRSRVKGNLRLTPQYSAANTMVLLKLFSKPFHYHWEQTSTLHVLQTPVTHWPFRTHFRKPINKTAGICSKGRLAPTWLHTSATADLSPASTLLPPVTTDPSARIAAHECQLLELGGHPFS